MPITETWDETKPAGSDDPRAGDDEIRRHMRAIRERMRNGGHEWIHGVGSSFTEGRHKTSEAQESGGTGELVGEFCIYGDDGTTKLVIVRGPSAASPNQFAVRGLEFRDIVSANLTLGQSTQVSGNLNVTGTAQFTGSVTASAGATANGPLTVDSRYVGRVTLVSGDYSIAASDHTVIGNRSAGGAFNVTLPAVASHHGRVLHFFNASSVATATMSLVRSGSDLIMDTSGSLTTYSLAKGAGAVLIAVSGTVSGSVWCVIARQV